MNNTDADHIQPIVIALKANTPLLYINSREEDRVIKAIENCCLELGRKMWCYAISEGLWTVDFLNTGELIPEIVHGRPNPDYRDPLGLLCQIKDLHAPRKGAVFLLLDFHEYLMDGVIRRHLRDLKKILKKQNCSIIILAPSTEIPRSLANDVWCYDFPLPSPSEMITHAGAIINRNRNKLSELVLDDDLKQIAGVAKGLTLDRFLGCVDTAFARKNIIASEDITREIVDSKMNAIKQSLALEWIEDDHRVAIGGLMVLKEWLSQRRQGFSAHARQYGLPMPKGILLLGVPGCGKSMAARLTSRLWDLPLLRLDTGSLFTSRVGGSEERTRQALKTAEAVSPCVLWIDEVEKGMAGINSSADSDGGTTARVFASLATWMQEKTAPVFVVATANSVEALPPEMLRKGRWDDVFFVDLPGLGERKEIVTIHLKKKGQNPGTFDARLIAEMCDGFSGAEIEQAIITGLYEAFDNCRPMTTEDVVSAVKAQVPLSVTMAEDIEQLRTWAMTRTRPASRDDVQGQRTAWRRGKTGNIRVIGEQR